MPSTQEYEQIRANRVGTATSPKLHRASHAAWRCRASSEQIVTPWICYAASNAAIEIQSFSSGCLGIHVILNLKRSINSDRDPPTRSHVVEVSFPYSIFLLEVPKR